MIRIRWSYQRERTRGTESRSGVYPVPVRAPPRSTYSRVEGQVPRCFCLSVWDHCLGPAYSHRGWSDRRSSKRCGVEDLRVSRRSSSRSSMGWRAVIFKWHVPLVVDLENYTFIPHGMSFNSLFLRLVPYVCEAATSIETRRRRKENIGRDTS